jgi:hypothetical protein
MRRSALVLVLLLVGSCATAPTPRPWPPAMTIEVFSACVTRVEHQPRFCLCFAHALELASPDPEKEATPDEVTAAAKACRGEFLERAALGVEL